MMPLGAWDPDSENLGKPPEHAIKAGRAADKEDKNDAELFAVMLKTDAWKAFVTRINRMIEKQGQIVLEPAQSVDRAMGLEYEKGTMRGLLMAIGLPQSTIDSATQINSDPETD